MKRVIILLLLFLSTVFGVVDNTSIYLTDFAVTATDSATGIPTQRVATYTVAGKVYTLTIDLSLETNATTGEKINKGNFSLDIQGENSSGSTVVWHNVGGIAFDFTSNSYDSFIFIRKLYLDDEGDSSKDASILEIVKNGENL